MTSPTGDEKYDRAWNIGAWLAARSMDEAVRSYIAAYTDKEGKVRVARVHEALSREKERRRPQT